MAVLPVIVRELRAQARQPLTYWLRLVGGGALACALGSAMWTLAKLGPNGPRMWLPEEPGAAYHTFGLALFGKLNLFIFAAIWVFVPLAAADAVSRERREGTLALLYLSKLRAGGIVVGKAFVHMLRSMSLFLTMAPWLVLPVLFGGVEWRDIRMALLLDFTAVLLAMAAGLLASTFPRDWLKSVMLAELIAALLLLSMLYVHAAVLRQTVAAGRPLPGRTTSWLGGLYDFDEFYSYHEGLIGRTSRLLSVTTDGTIYPPEYWGISSDPVSDWQQIWTRLTPAGHAAWLRGVVGMVAGAGLVLLGALWLGARRVAASWREQPREGPASELRRTLFAPRFAVPLLTRKLSRALNANPIGWLQVYSPSARLVKWAWCLFVILVDIAFSGNWDDLYSAQKGLGLILLLGMVFSATGSFREELETGAFELLLVTPLREWQVIAGRARGLWRQFLPAVLVYGTGSIYLASGWSSGGHAPEAWLALARTLTGFCALPLVGLYFSVQRWNFLAAWLAACGVGFGPPALARAWGVPETWVLALQLGIGLCAVLLLQRRLRNRGFLRAGGR